MNLWPYAVLSVLGSVGMVAAFRPWYDELSRVVEMEQATGQATTMRERRKMLFWSLPVIGFGVVGAIGDVGLIIYFTGKMLS